MAYIGNQPTTVAFLTDQFSGTGSQTAFTLSAAPANTSSILVAVTGVLQAPSTYSVSGTTLTFSVAPPSGTGNISVRFLGIPASGITTAAYRTQNEFTATAGQTTFTPSSYTPGFIDVYRNGLLLGSADYTATDGTTIVLTNAASAGDFIETNSFLISSVLNAIPATPGAVTATYLASNSAVLSLNGSAGALKGAVLTGTTSIAAGSTSVDVTNQMTNAGWYMITIQYILSNTASATTVVFRTSSNNGSSFDAGASDYDSDLFNVGTVSTSSSIQIMNSTAAASTYPVTTYILMYTGSASTAAPTFDFFTHSATNLSNAQPNQGFFGKRNSYVQANAIQLIRTSGTKTFNSGTINVYYLGQ